MYFDLNSSEPGAISVLYLFVSGTYMQMFSIVRIFPTKRSMNCAAILKPAYAMDNVALPLPFFAWTISSPPY